MNPTTFPIEPGAMADLRARLAARADELTLLDVAYSCRVRPSVHGEPVPPGRLVALDAAGPSDPVLAPALDYLRATPRRPVDAIKALARRTEGRLVGWVGRLHAGITDGTITPDGLRWCIEQCLRAGRIEKLELPGLKPDRKAVLELDGGELEIEWREDGHVWMTGPVEVERTGALP